MKLLTGVVRFFDDAAGAGFIRPDDGTRDCFAHRKNIRASGSSKTLAAGQRVVFSIEQTEQGPRAVHILPRGYSAPITER
jgi:CspA family cold shock protein